jgi:hypothetical protein
VRCTFEETIQTILDDVIAFHEAQYGAVQLPLDDNLVIAAQRGFAPKFLQMFRHLKKDEHHTAINQGIWLQEFGRALAVRWPLLDLHNAAGE